MLHLVILFLITALIAGMLGFSGAFYIAVILFVLALSANLAVRRIQPVTAVKRAKTRR